MKNILKKERNNKLFYMRMKLCEFFFFPNKNVQYCIWNGMCVCVLPTPSFIFMTLYHSLCVILYHWKVECVTSCAIQARNVITFIIFFSLFSRSYICMCIENDEHTARTASKLNRIKEKGKCQRSFRRRHLFFFLRRRQWVPSVILYSETVILFILVHYL